MDEKNILEELEELLQKFGVQIRHEPIKQEEDSIHIAGGLCLLRGEYVLIIDSRAATRDKLWTLGMAVKQFDVEEIYIRPVLREFLERIPDQGRWIGPR